jgi:hypothetical protein
MRVRRARASAGEERGERREERGERREERGERREEEEEERSCNTADDRRPPHYHIPPQCWMSSQSIAGD